MKGATEALSAILVTGVLISVVGSVYFWGLPLVQKNKDIATLESSENFMVNLKNKIKTVANNGGREELIINVPGILIFDGSSLNLVVDTQGTQYAKGATIPLGRNECNLQTGVWGLNEPETFCVFSEEIGESKFTTTYTLKFVQLDTIISDQIKGPESFTIDTTGTSSRGGEGKTVLIENTGTERQSVGDSTLVKTKVSIKIQS
jgi:hypothetical protein